MRKIGHIIWLDEVDSTNNMAKCHIDDFSDMTVLSAVKQNKGRGQRGNTWSSIPGQNLTFSIILKHSQEDKPKIQAHKQFVLSELTSLALIELLSNYDIKAKIKWPNDIYVNDKKICGMLIENAIKGKLLNTSIIGIGLNVNQQEFNPSIHPEPTSILKEKLENPSPKKLEDIKSINLDMCIKHFLVIFERYCGFLTSEKDYNILEKMYNDHLYRKNEEHQFILKKNGEKFNGTIKSVSPRGLIRIKIHNNIEAKEDEIQDFAFNEISYII